MTNTEIRNQLFAWQDVKYRDFTAKLNPTIDKETIIGVRNPQIKPLAKEIARTGVDSFLLNPPTDFHEERMLYGWVLGFWKTDIDSFLAAFDRWLPFVNNWAVCDSGVMSMKILGKKANRVKAWQYLTGKLESTNEPYEIRAVIVALFSYFIDDEYVRRTANVLQNIRSEHYYVNMALAWAWSVILVKHYELGVNIIKSQALSKWVQNKSIQKAVESSRISDEQKQELKQYKNQESRTKNQESRIEN